MSLSPLTLNTSQSIANLRAALDKSNAKEITGVGSIDDQIGAVSFIKNPRKYWDGWKVVNQTNGPTTVQSGGQHLYQIKENNGYIGEIYLVFTALDATNLVAAPDVGYRVPKDISLDLGGAKQLVYTGTGLWSYWNVHLEEEPLVKKQLHELAGGDSLTITTAKRFAIKLYGYGSTHPNSQIQPFPLSGSVDGKMDIAVNWNTYDKIFTSATTINETMTQFTCQLFYRVIQSEAFNTDTGKPPVGIYNHKYFKSKSYTFTPTANEWTSIDVTSQKEAAELREIILLPRRAASIAAGTLLPWKTTDCVPQKIRLMRDGDVLYETEAAIEYDIINFLKYNDDHKMAGTTYADNRLFPLCLQVKKMGYLGNREIVINGIEYSESNNLKIEIVFDHAQPVNMEVIFIYTAFSGLAGSGKFEMEYGK